MSDVATGAVPMIDLWRGDRLEGRHLGHTVICDGAGTVIEAWGNPGAMIYPRSSCKMIQALPLLETGAGVALNTAQLALACASHQGSARHVSSVRAWLDDLGLGEADLRCGNQEPADRDERDRLIRAHQPPCQLHNNCSGKHAGFLMLNRHLGGDAEYIDPDHPVQKAVRAAFEEVTDETSPGFGIDGCSAPNFMTSLHGLARAAARFATAGENDARGRAMVRLREAMMMRPDMVAGETGACTELMRAMGSTVALKTGAEAVYLAIVPSRNLGVALKIIDGGTRASEAAITVLLARLGVIDPAHPLARKRFGAPLTNRRGIETGALRLAPGFAGA